jgi:hypothetical protein
MERFSTTAMWNWRGREAPRRREHGQGEIAAEVE